MSQGDLLDSVHILPQRRDFRKLLVAGRSDDGASSSSRGELKRKDGYSTRSLRKHSLARKKALETVHSVKGGQRRTGKSGGLFVAEVAGDTDETVVGQLRSRR